MMGGPRRRVRTQLAQSSSSPWPLLMSVSMLLLMLVLVLVLLQHLLLPRTLPPLRQDHRQQTLALPFRLHHPTLNRSWCLRPAR